MNKAWIQRFLLLGIVVVLCTSVYSQETTDSKIAAYKIVLQTAKETILKVTIICDGQMPRGSVKEITDIGVFLSLDTRDTTLVSFIPYDSISAITIECWFGSQANVMNDEVYKSRMEEIGTAMRAISELKE